MFYDPESGRRCRRNGTGSPALCQRCRDELDGEPTPFADILSSVLKGKRPSQDSVEKAAKSVMEGIFGRTMTPEEIGRIFEQTRAAREQSSSSQSSGSDSDARSSSSRAQEHDEAEKARLISWARRTLGFTAKEALTKEAVKKRFRELARKHHPDMGGTKEKMADLNRAMEILVG